MNTKTALTALSFKSATSVGLTLGAHVGEDGLYLEFIIQRGPLGLMILEGATAALLEDGGDASYDVTLDVQELPLMGILRITAGAGEVPLWAIESLNGRSGFTRERAVGSTEGWKMGGMPFFMHMPERMRKALADLLPGFVRPPKGVKEPKVVSVVAPVKAAAPAGVVFAGDYQADLRAKQVDAVARAQRAQRTDQAHKVRMNAGLAKAERATAAAPVVEAVKTERRETLAASIEAAAAQVLRELKPEPQKARVNHTGRDRRAASADVRAGRTEISREAAQAAQAQVMGGKPLSQPLKGFGQLNLEGLV